MSDKGRNPGLDLARFLAVACVLATHIGAGLMPLFGVRVSWAVLDAAYFGVELFFVLSGFLIGGLLFEIVQREPSLRAWWAFMLRRWLRTLPLYLGWLVLLPVLVPAPAHLLWHQVHYALMVQNLVWPMPSDGWFNESWSLAIEEWFYLLFSITLIAGVGLTRRRGMAWVVTGAFLVLPAIARAIWSPSYGPEFYHVVLMRLDAIAYGVALAGLHRRGSRLFHYPRAALLAGLAGVAMLWTQDVRGPWLPVPWLVWLNMKVVFTSVALCLFLTGLVQVRPRLGPFDAVVRFGARISYGVYIMHLALFVSVMWFAERHHLGNAVGLVATLTLSVLLPALSFRYLESPLLALRPSQFARRPAAGPRTDQDTEPSVLPAGSPEVISPEVMERGPALADPGRAARDAELLPDPLSRIDQPPAPGAARP